MSKIEFNVTPPDKLYLVMYENCLIPILNNDDKYIVLYKDAKPSMEFNKCIIYEVDAKQMHDENMLFDYVTDKDCYIVHNLPVKYVRVVFSTSGFLHSLAEDEKIGVATEESYTHFKGVLLDEIKKHNFDYTSFTPEDAKDTEQISERIHELKKRIISEMGVPPEIFKRDRDTFFDKLGLIYLQLEKGEIPEKFPDFKSAFNSSMFRYSEDVCSLYNFREYYTENFSFSIVSKNWLRILAHFIGDSKCLEIMGGTGLISKGLHDFGVDIICTDDYSWEEGGKPHWKRHFTDIERIDAVEAVKKYANNVSFIIMSWPYMDDTCYKAYKMMKEINPNCLMIYIGESAGGCTACDEFFLNTISSFDDINFGNEESPNFSSDIIDITRELNNKFTSFLSIHDRIHFIK